MRANRLHIHIHIREVKSSSLSAGREIHVIIGEKPTVHLLYCIGVVSMIVYDPIAKSEERVATTIAEKSVGGCNIENILFSLEVEVGAGCWRLF